MEPYYVLPLNPEPWAVGNAYVVRSGGKLTARVGPNPGLQSYQEAVREELADVKMLPPGRYRLDFYFWRQQAQYLDAADRKRQRNQADATNMQKALEDALQGVLFENDRDVAQISSTIVAQGVEVKPCIVIRAALIHDGNGVLLPHYIAQKVNEVREAAPKKSSNKWPPE